MDTKQVRHLLRTSAPHYEMQAYAKLLKMLPHEEQRVYAIVGDSEPALFEGGALLAEMGSQLLQVLRVWSGSSLARWPEIPTGVPVPPKEHGWDNSGSSLYDSVSAREAFAAWTSDSAQRLLNASADSFPPGFNWVAVCSSSADVAALLSLVSQHQFEAMMRHGQIYEWLQYTRRVAETGGWAATEVGREPALLMVLSGGHGPPIKSLAELLYAEGLASVLVDRAGETVRTRILGKPSWWPTPL